jgi:basic amino acid/polyamine antiporter, APA family
LLLIIGFAFGERVVATTAAPVATDYSGFGRALAAGLFSFGGWHMVTYTAAETHEPDRVIPRALMLGVLIVVACYIALNALYLYLLPLETVKASTRVAADAADAVLGQGGATLMSTLVVFSAFGALAGVILAGPRVYFAMAEDRQAFGWLAGVHPRFHTPHRAIMLQALWSSALVATGTYRALFTRVIYTEWLFFAVMAVGLMRVRRSATSSYRMPGFPMLPLLFIGAALFVAASAILASPIDSVIGLGIVLLGVPVYYLLATRRR